MIARLTWPSGATAELGDDLTWSSPEPAIAAHLNSAYRPSGHPADGEPGFAEAIAAAEALGAELVLAEVDRPYPDDAVH